MEERKEFIVGSTAFFLGQENFIPGDIDVFALVDNPKDFKNSRQIRLLGKPHRCIFEYRRMSKLEFILFNMKSNCGMVIGKFLVPDVANELKMTIDDLKMLEPLLDKLDEKHSYERLIYDYYIENNDFTLTKSQLDNVYEEYKKYRTTEQ